MAGQGSQYPGMAKDLYESVEAVRTLFDRAETIRPGTLSLMFDGNVADLKRTDCTQPCLFLADLASAIALEAEGIVPAATAGFSLGEIAALAVSGMLDAEDAFRLVCRRGELMQKAAERNTVLLPFGVPLLIPCHFQSCTRMLSATESRIKTVPNAL